MLPRSWRLTRKRDLQWVYQRGTTVPSPHLLLRYGPSRLSHPRLAVIISRKIAKKAVIRNRLKRLVRQAFQELIAPKASSTKGFDCIVTIHRDFDPPYELARIKPEVAQCFAKLS